MITSSRRVLVLGTALSACLGWMQVAPSVGQTPAGRSAVSSAVDDVDGDLWRALTPLDRQILEFVNVSQLDELLNGADPSNIYLSNGETLDVLAERAQNESSRNLLFAPVRACRLFDTREAAQGQLLPGETRGFSVRVTEEGYAAQGGALQGCGLPGLSGVTLRTNTVRAVALNVMTLDVGGPGSLAIWPSNRSEPEIGSVSFASALAGGGVTGGVLVPVCDEAGLDPCSAGDLKIKAKMSGAHVVADVVGYFHAGVGPQDGLQAGGDSRRGASRDYRDSSRDLISQRVQDSAPDSAASSSRTRATEEATKPVSRTVTLADGRTRSTLLPSRAPVGSAPPFSSPARTGDVPGDPPLGDPISPISRGGLGQFVSGIKGELATGHGAGAAVHAVIPNDQANYDAAAVKGHTLTTGLGVYGVAPNGRAVYGQTENGYAVYGYDGGSQPNEGYAGYFYSWNGIGVYGYSNGNRAHPNILAPGVYGQSNQGVGVYGRGDTSNSYSFYNEGGYFEGGKGLYARGTDSSGEQGYGARIYSNNYRGLYVQGGGGHYAGYFVGGGVYSSGGFVSGAAPSSVLAINVGAEPIEPGDLVAMAGLDGGPEGDQPMLAVAKLNATNRGALIGVAREAYEVKAIRDAEGTAHIDYSPVAGAISANGYLSIITEGLAPAVKISSLTRASGWRIGDRIDLSTTGTLEQSTRAVDAVALGRVAALPDPGTGTVAIYLGIH